MSYESLIADCSVISDHYLRKDNAPGEEYNIYKILNVTNNEVLMCRVLADLLSPQGRHGNGSRFIGDFLRNVLGMNITDNELEEAHVYKEYLITNDRRIDLVIRYRSTFIPIEVKINAGEQKSQCYDYYRYALTKDANARVIYLTKYGSYPSDYSVYGGEANEERVPEDKIRCISFREDITGWLGRIIELTDSDMATYLNQYIGAIKDFTENENEDYMMELSDKISQNSDNLRMAIDISKAVGRAKVQTMRLLFEEFEKQMQPVLEKYSLEEERRSGWFHYRDQAGLDFYAHADSTYPGINYVIKDVSLPGGLSLWLRIEVEYRLFAGLCLFNYDLKSDFGEGNQQDEISDETWELLKEYVSLPEKNNSGSWVIDWVYLPTGSSSTSDEIDSVPDFKAMNEAAIRLADEENREIFVSKCIRIIEETILSKIRGKGAEK